MERFTEYMEEELNLLVDKDLEGGTLTSKEQKRMDYLLDLWNEIEDMKLARQFKSQLGSYLG